ncbi:MAG: VapE family protein, partial [Azospirillaceae bacterium]
MRGGEIRDVALAYAAQGIPVFPCWPDKKPRVTGGFKAATTDPAMIDTWWKDWPDAMIGMPTGEPSRLIVLDVDVDSEKDLDGQASLAALEAEYGPLPATRTQRTPRGGTHHIFAWPGHEVSSSAGKLGRGLDVRGDGGYVILAPSVNGDGGCYSTERDCEAVPAPDWLQKLATSGGKARREPKSTPCSTISPLALLDPYVETALRKEVERVSSSPKGERNDTLNRAAFSLGQLVGGGCLDRDRVEKALVDAAEASGLVNDDGLESVNRTIDSGLEAGLRQPRGAPDSRLRNLRPPLGRVNTKREADESWRGGFVLTDKGGVIANHANLSLVLEHHPDWQGVVAFDEFRDRVMLLKEIPNHQRPGQCLVTTRPLVDDDVIAAVAWFNLDDFPRVRREMVHEVLANAARRHTVHPVRDYLESLVWDGTPRLDGWLATYGSAEYGALAEAADQARYVKEVGTCWLISAVARVMRPGCQADHMLILEGPQGIGKSSALRILAGDEWFTDNLGDLSSKDARDALRGRLIVEISELAAMKRADTEAIKAFITRREEHFRPAYARCEITYRRQCVFAGTSNRSDFLRDATGNRRFWPVA